MRGIPSSVTDIRKRVFKSLGNLHYTADVYKIFASEQKYHNRGYEKFWRRLKKDNQLIIELLFRPQLHSKLSGGTYKTLVYAFAKAYYERTNIPTLKAYADALVVKYQTGYDSFANIVKQREKALINHILDEIRVSDMCNDKKTQVFMRQAMTLLVISSKMKYDEETEQIIDYLLDEFEEGRAQM